jgi:hypothetical protein
MPANTTTKIPPVAIVATLLHLRVLPLQYLRAVSCRNGFHEWFWAIVCN